MDVVVALEHRFDRTPDGIVWTQVAYAQQFWTRYLTVFDAVHVVARVREVASAPANGMRADGDGVSFAKIPYYVGPWQYLARSLEIRRAARHAIDPDNAVILRVPSPIAASVLTQMRRDKRPYGLEVVGDPFDVFAPDAVRHPLRPFFRMWFTHNLRKQCAGACAAAYVTETTLQRRYPVTQKAFSTHYSSIELHDSAISSEPRSVSHDRLSFTLITVGSLAQMYKAPDVLIDAVAACVRQGLDLKLVVVGEGKHRPEMEAKAEVSGLRKRVRFLGQLPAGDPIRAELDQADIFILPSRQEGLPRAMIEAMARALPSIGSTVGGIPELLPDEDMVPPGNVDALARKIHEVLSDPLRMAKMSARNLEKAKEYREEALRERRLAFYRHVREKTEAWLQEEGHT